MATLAAASLALADGPVAALPLAPLGSLSESGDATAPTQIRVGHGGAGRPGHGGAGRPGYGHGGAGRPGHPGAGRPGYGHPGYGRPGYGRPGYRPGRGAWVRPYRWPAGGAIAAGAAIGFVTAATAAAWASAPPAPGLCWYYTDASRRNGFWDTCP